MPLDVHAQGRSGGGVGGEDGGAGVPLLLGGVPKLQDALSQGEGRLPPLHLRLLEAEEIRPPGLVEIQKALLHAGPQAIHVPRNKYHCGLLIVSMENEPLLGLLLSPAASSWGIVSPLRIPLHKLSNRNHSYQFP